MKKILLGFIIFYRKFISPMKGYSSCKFYPTCSTYALEAVEKYGAFKGGYLAIKRVLRCNPFSRGGYDPVPYKFNIVYWRKKYDDEFTFSG